MSIQEERDIADKYGFITESDPGRGGGWGRYHKGDVHVWLGSWSHPWIRSTFIDGRYSDHQYMEGLEDAMSNKNGKPLKVLDIHVML